MTNPERKHRAEQALEQDHYLRTGHENDPTVVGKALTGIMDFIRGKLRGVTKQDEPRKRRWIAFFED